MYLEKRCLLLVLLFVFEISSLPRHEDEALTKSASLERMKSEDLINFISNARPAKSPLRKTSFSIRDILVKKQMSNRKPEAMSDVPEVESPQPEAMSDLPEVESRQPEAMSDVPEVESRQPEAMSDVPEVESRQPEAMSDVPEVEYHQPEVMSGVPEVDSHQPELTSAEVISSSVPEVRKFDKKPLERAYFNDLVPGGSYVDEELKHANLSKKQQHPCFDHWVTERGRREAKCKSHVINGCSSSMIMHPTRKCKPVLVAIQNEWYIKDCECDD